MNHRINLLCDIKIDRKITRGYLKILRFRERQTEKKTIRFVYFPLIFYYNSLDNPSIESGVDEFNGNTKRLSNSQLQTFYKPSSLLKSLENKLFFNSCSNSSQIGLQEKHSQIRLIANLEINICLKATYDVTIDDTQMCTNRDQEKFSLRYCGNST